MNIKEVKNMLKIAGYRIADKMSPVSKEIVMSHMKAAAIEARLAVAKETYAFARKSMDEIKTEIMTNNPDASEEQINEWLAYWAIQKKKTNEEWENEWQNVILEVDQEYDALKNDPDFINSLIIEQKSFREDREFERQQNI